MRLSGVCDDIPIIVSDKMIDVLQDWRSETFEVHGEYRSRMQEGHLILYVFADYITQMDVTVYGNQIDLCGYICKKPIYRKTPLGKEISDFILKVNRPYGNSDYIPCIAWWKNATYARDMEIGTHIKITGRIQIREYQKQISEKEYETRTAYEVSISQMEVIECEERKDQVTNDE